MTSLACALKGLQGERVALTNVSVAAVMNDLLAEVTMCQSYRNDEPVNIEAVYTFPLPLDAVLLDLQVEIGGRVLKGVVVEKKAAEEKYEDAIAEGDAAVMLEILEPGLYTMNVGNLLPNENATITFSYSVLYRWVGERLRVFIPTTIATRFGDSPHGPRQAPASSLFVENRFSLRMEIFGSLRDAQFTCPSHQVTFAPSTDKVVVSLEREKAAMDRDFILNVKALKASRSFAVCGSDGEGVAAIASFQPFFPGLQQPRQLNLAIVIDCSGSMQGDSIEQAKKAVGGIVDSLQASDRVALIAFGNTTYSLWNQLTPCTPANREAATHFAKQLASNMGGTQIGTALQTAYGVLSDVSSADILLITDGEVSAWRPVIEEARISGRRIFTVGVGNAVSEAFVRELAASTGGECELVSPREDMAERVIRHFERMRAPRAKRVIVHWPDDAFEVAPNKPGAVFDGDTVISSARFNDSSAAAQVALEVETETGETTRSELSISMAGSQTSEDQISTVARFAASMRLKELNDDAALNAALRYRLVSPWTNWLVIAARPEGLKAQDIPAIRKVPQTDPAMSILCSMQHPMSVRPPSAMREVVSSGILFQAGPVPGASAPLGSKSFLDGFEFFSSSSTKRSIPNIVEFLKAVPAEVWHEISLWASRDGLLDLSQRASAYWEMVRLEPNKQLSYKQARYGFDILREAHQTGFKLADTILSEARTLGVELSA